MTARTVYEAAVKSAATAKTATLIANETTKQETINASGVNVGYYPGKGGSGEAAFQAAVKTANQAKWDADFAAEQAKQAAHMVARDTLRAAGDLAPL
jgi:hypothetical protein